MATVDFSSKVSEPVAEAVAALDGIERMLLQQVNCFTEIVRLQYDLTGTNPLSAAADEQEPASSREEIFEEVGLLHPQTLVTAAAARDACVARRNAVEAQELVDAAIPRKPLEASEALPPERRAELKAKEKIRRAQ